MAGAKDQDKLLFAKIDRALQKPAMILYVPLHSVFVPEVIIVFILFAVIKFWFLALLPLHYVLVIKSEENYFWVDDLLTNISETWLSSSAGLRGKNVISHQPFFVKNPNKSDILK